MRRQRREIFDVQARVAASFSAARGPLDQRTDRGIVAVNRAIAKLNDKIYVPMQGPSELGASGKLANWDRSKDLSTIQTRTLVIGAKYETMDPAHI